METLKSATFDYLRHSLDNVSTGEYVTGLKKAAPNILWSIQCYHYETRTRTVSSTDSNGRTTTRTETYQVRVNTHSASGSLLYRSWTDRSDTLSDQIYKFNMTKMKLTKSYTCDIGYNQQRSQFIVCSFVSLTPSRVLMTFDVCLNIHRLTQNSTVTTETRITISGRIFRFLDFVRSTARMHSHNVTSCS